MRIKPENDAYGEELWAFYHGQDSQEIIERDDGFIDLSSGPRAYFAGYEEWPSHEKEAMESAKGRVLDIGCGAGRHSLYLQQKGLDVTAIDNSPLAIKVCKLRGVKDARVMDVSDISKFKPGSFDTVLMMCNNFGLLASPGKAKTILKNLHKITSPEAVIIGASRDTHKTSDREHFQYQRMNRKAGRLPGQIRIRVRFRKFVGEWFDYMLVSQKEMAQLLKGTCWKIQEIIDSGDAYYIAIIGKG